VWIPADSDVPRVPTVGIANGVRWLRAGAVATTTDLIVWSVATVGAIMIRFDGMVPSWTQATAALLALGAFKLLVSAVFGLHLASWRKFSFSDARRVCAAVATATAGAIVLNAMLPVPILPAGVLVLDGLLTAALMLGARGAVRYVDEGTWRRSGRGRRHRDVLLVGAGEAGALLARELLRHPETGMHPVGFLDDDAAKVGRTIGSVPVLGRVDQVAQFVTSLGIDEVLICIPSADGRSIRAIVDHVRAVAPEVPCRTMPALHEVLSGQVQINRIRDVTIDDLLRRPAVELDTGGIHDYIRGRRVMVTGAGGSIGSELIRQLCRFEPGELILFGHGENSIYQLERELDVGWPNVRYVSVIAQVQNVVRLENVFQTYQPEVIFHTAAHKHVPLMERNPEEAVFNNVVGSRNLVDLAVKYGVTHFVNISTDKAVNPTSVMGSTKRIVEMIVEEASRRARPGQAFVSVRFGNVLGSRGSAVPIFKKQIAAGGPVTVTHPDMVRYFMTIPEASRLVLQASAQGRNGEIYILDMGEPVRVLDLVEDLIRLSGLEPHVDIPIVFTGTRPGEKLYEELMTEGERAGRTQHEKIYVARPRPIDAVGLDQTINDLIDAALRSDGDAIRLILAERIEGARLVLHDGRVTHSGAGAVGRSAAAP
jgi:FlaA1/EpsC-like NDP-sugar epimerase